MFAVTGIGIEPHLSGSADHDDYNAILLKALPTAAGPSPNACTSVRTSTGALPDEALDNGP